ncbi:CBO0543 family protein [Caldibacillus thermoamylovorans]
MLDKWVTAGYISYPTRLLPNIFHIHILYDVLLYPMFTVIYNQITSKDKLIAVIYKVFFFSVPLTIFESWAERKTGLIKWISGWRWYHTFLSVNLKSLITRGMVSIHRKCVTEGRSGIRGTPNPIYNKSNNMINFFIV